MIPTREGACNLAQVLSDEAGEIDLQCEARGVAGDLKLGGGWAPVPDRLGLALSGGGIRSACVALGIVQRLAQARMLAQVHTICGISGGGYLLGWLTAWIKREGSLKWVEEQLCHSAASPPAAPAGTEPFAYKRFVEPYAIHYLRRYSSYLTPRVGLLSGDTLAMISVYLRNLLLNQTMLAMLAVSVMLVLQLLSPAIFWSHRIGHRTMGAALAVFALIFSYGLFIGTTALSRLGGGKSASRESPSAAAHTIASGVLACIMIWWMTPSWYAEFTSEMATVAAVAMVTVAGTIVSAVLFRKRIAGDTLQAVDQASPSIALLFVSWLVVGTLCCLLDWLYRKWLIFDSKVWIGDSYTILGLPCLLFGLAFVSYAFLGILGSKFPDPKREWLARVAGYFFLWAVVIAGITGIALLGPLVMHLLFTSWQIPSWKKYVVSALIPGGWLFVVVTGLLGANSAKSAGTPGQTSKLDTVIAIAPPVFIVGVLLLVSWSTHKLVAKTVARMPHHYLSFVDWRGSSRPTVARFDQVRPSTASFDRHALKPSSVKATIRAWFPAWTGRYFFVWLLPTLIAALLAVRLDVNEFSLHLFYRNRLVRAFLGASNNLPEPRRPSPFTGFASDDDIALEDLSRHSTVGKPFQGPYPIWGTTLNLTTGEDLAWQQRKGASFIYSPLFCGFDYVKSFTATETPEAAEIDPDSDALARPKTSRMNLHGFRSTIGNPLLKIEGYGGTGGRPFLGTAMAASGAAVSPNMGYHTRPGVAALLALFNLRLGWWSGNPRSPSHWKRYAPGIWYLAAELLGQTGDKSKYVYLSDGGHFENLGIYELVRRKTRFIICSDADADPEFSFKDLGNAIDRCRRDFGVEIHVRAQRDVCAEGGKQFRSGHYAIGEICYPGQTARGILLYIKSSLTSDEPSDVLGMKASDSDFPHDSTANQFFNEAMFESYRALGEHMMDVILDKNGVSNQEASPRDAVAKLFTSLNAKAREQREADKTPKPSPFAVTVAGGVTVHMDA